MTSLTPSFCSLILKVMHIKQSRSPKANSLSTCSQLMVVFLQTMEVEAKRTGTLLDIQKALKLNTGNSRLDQTIGHIKTTTMTLMSINSTSLTLVQVKVVCTRLKSFRLHKLTQSLRDTKSGRSQTISTSLQISQIPRQTDSSLSRTSQRTHMAQTSQRDMLTIHHSSETSCGLDHVHTRVQS